MSYINADIVCRIVLEKKIQKYVKKLNLKKEAIWRILILNKNFRLNCVRQSVIIDKLNKFNI